MTSQQLQNLIDRLRQKGWHLATAESCTGGLLAKTLTDQPGVSDVFECGMICYSNRIKQEKLHIPEAFLRDYGAVSEPRCPRHEHLHQRICAGRHRHWHHRRRPDRTAARTNRWVWYTFRYISSPKTSCTAASCYWRATATKSVRLPSTPY